MYNCSDIWHCLVTILKGGIKKMSEYIPSQEKIIRVLKNENSDEYDVGYYMGIKSMEYHKEKADILWGYISDKDIPEIEKKLEELEK